MALPFLISSFLIPLIGMFIDKEGKRITCLIIAAALGIVTYIMFISVTPFIPLILLGIQIIIKIFF